MRKKLLAGLGAMACVLGIALLTPASASAADSTSYQATLNPITANHVTGSGTAMITLTGNSAEVKVEVSGLLDGAPHAQHIHIDALGQCPSAPQQHNGQASINVADGAPFYGAIGTSLTNAGDTSPAAGLAVTEFPSTGSYTYTRTIELDPNVPANLQKRTAVLIRRCVPTRSTRPCAARSLPCRCPACRVVRLTPVAARPRPPATEPKSV